MLQLSKVIHSRDEWKAKATESTSEAREQRKTIKRLREQLAEDKRVIKTLQQAVENEKKNKAAATAQVVEIKQAQEVRSLCVLLVIQAVVSYRSIPRILDLFNTETLLRLGWVPHFTSVINWTLRLGLGLLKQVTAINTPWLAIIDYSIDIGTKKALVVLRVSVESLSKRGSAICLEDCECIGLKVSDIVNGETVALDLETIFKKSGMPIAIIKDSDSTLQKGVRLCLEKQDVKIPVIADIGHSMATALKYQFEKTEIFKRFTALLTKCANHFRQTELAFLIPPKLRSKGRFQSISTLGKWSDRILDAFAIKGRAKKGSLLDKLRTAMPGFLILKPFIMRFARILQVVAQAMEILKNRGLDQNTYEECYKLSNTLPKNSKIKIRLQKWLKEHLEIQKQITDAPLLVSSDIIESLFGRFKHVIERSPQADMNRTTLLIPALCGRLDKTTITNALSQIRHNDLEMWEKENIPYTVRKKRQAFFADINIQKPGKT